MATVTTFCVLLTLLVLSAVYGLEIEEELDALENEGPAAYAALHGLKLDVHEVVTSDDWLLQVFRIRNLDIYDELLSSPVLISHGYTSSAVDFMVNARNESLSFILADRGFDVWAINYRGTLFSNEKIVNGTAVTAEGEDYFNVTWQHMAEDDLVATIDTILNSTKQEKLHLIGHSMGCATLFALLSENHRYDDRIGLFTALAPVIKFGDDTPFWRRQQLKAVAYGIKNLSSWFDSVTKLVLGRQISTPMARWTRDAGSKFLQSFICDYIPICGTISSLIFEVNVNDYSIREERIPIYYINNPGGTSMLNTFHFARQLGRDPWTKFDYSEIPALGVSNMDVYGQKTPPAYNFSATNVSLSLYFVDRDQYLGKNTSFKIIDMLGRPQFKYLTNSSLTHHEMVWGWNARCFIYDDIIEDLSKLEMKRDGQRNKFHSETIPKYLSKLQFENGCQRKPDE